MRVRALICAICIGCHTQLALAEEQPSIELLEFLGDWETQQGQWIDPTQFGETPELAQVDKEEAKDE